VSTPHKENLLSRAIMRGAPSDVISDILETLDFISSIYFAASQFQLPECDLRELE
jgi:hypothetical protein